MFTPKRNPKIKRNKGGTTKGIGGIPSRIEILNARKKKRNRNPETPIRPTPHATPVDEKATSGGHANIA